MQNERRFSIVLLFAGITAAYANSLGGPFQFDDYSVIVNRSSVHSFSAWLTDGGIRPVLKLSYMLNWVSGLGTVGFHLFNLGIHSANTFLVYRLCNLIASEWKSADGRSVSNLVAAAAATIPIFLPAAYGPLWRWSRLPSLVRSLRWALFWRESDQ